MNAPNAALLAARATAPRHLFTQQKTIPAGLTLLMASYAYGEFLMDLWGYADDEDGCCIEAVAPAGTDIDMTFFLQPPQMKTLEMAVDRAGVQARAASRDEGRAERALFDRATA